MPEAENTTAISIASRKRRERAKKLGLPVPNVEWGPFRQLRACALIRRSLTLNAQHVTLMLALETPPDGVVIVSHKELHELTGRAPATITAALTEAINAGLLFGKRTIGTFVYVWAESVYKSNGVENPRKPS